MSAACYHKKGQFLYRTSPEAPVREFPSDSLAITALHFIPQTLTLCLGYSFGSFQLFSVPKMSVVHSSPCPKALAPVTHFLFQEPENDPKHNIFLWVARGNPPFTRYVCNCIIIIHVCASIRTCTYMYNYAYIIIHTYEYQCSKKTMSN